MKKRSMKKYQNKKTKRNIQRGGYEHNTNKELDKSSFFLY